MKNLILPLLLTLPMFANATAMDPEVSRCRSLQAAKLEMSKWITTYNEFKADKSVSAKVRWTVSYKGAQKAVRLIEEMRALSGQQGSLPILNDAKRLFDAIEKGEITKQGSQFVLTRGLENLREKMDEVTYQAEIKADCELVPRSSGFNPGAGEMSLDQLSDGVE